MELELEMELGQQVIVIADVTRVKQVLINLATNALKFTNTGFVKMTARAVSSADAANMALVLPSLTELHGSLTSSGGHRGPGLLYLTYDDSGSGFGSKGSKGNLRATYPAPISSTSQQSVVVVEVADSGCGLKLEDYERVFTRFFTKHGENNLRGLGLGLPISNEVVRASVGCVA